jgi:Ferritin-like
VTREQLFDEIDFLARIEHSLCVEFLSIHCALGHDQLPGPGETGRHVAEAAEAALATAKGEMSHLSRVNSALTAAGRPPQVGRASSIPSTAGEISLAPFTQSELERFLDRERQVAAAVDERYTRVVAALESPDPVVDGELLGQLSFLLTPAPDHLEPVADLERHLDGISSAEFLRATPQQPATEVERTLVALSDQHYALTVSLVRASFAHDDELEGELRGRALAMMDGLNGINGMLVKRGLLPPFTPPAEGPAPAPNS